MLVTYADLIVSSLYFFFNDTATTEIYTLSLHDALPISFRSLSRRGERFRQLDHGHRARAVVVRSVADRVGGRDRKSTRLNSSHLVISYAVFCLKKKTIIHRHAFCIPLRLHFWIGTSTSM